MAWLVVVLLVIAGLWLWGFLLALGDADDLQDAAIRAFLFVPVAGAVIGLLLFFFWLLSLALDWALS